MTYRKTFNWTPWRSIFKPFLSSGGQLEVEFKPRLAFYFSNGSSNHQNFKTNLALLRAKRMSPIFCPILLMERCCTRIRCNNSVNLLLLCQTIINKVHRESSNYLYQLLFTAYNQSAMILWPVPCFSIC